MHPSILAQRKAKAVQRIVTQANALVNGLALDPALAESLQPKGVKDPKAAEMMRLEGLADLLDVIAAVTVVTEETEPDSKPMDETLPGPVFGEELPPPVLEEELDTVPSKKVRSSKRKK